VDFGTKNNTIKQELNLNVLALNLIFFSCKNCSGSKKLLWKKLYHIHGLDLTKQYVDQKIIFLWAKKLFSNKTKSKIKIC
jgi:hypothetical protein